MLIFVHREKGLLLSVYVDDIKIGWKETKYYSDVEAEFDPMRKILNKEVDLGDPTSFLDHVYLRCTQRQCEVSKDIVDTYRTMFEFRIPQEQRKDYQAWKHRRFPRGLTTWKVMPKSVWNAFVNWQTKQRNRCTTNVSTLCLDDHQFKEEEMKSVGELSKLCSEIVLTSLYLARIGRPDILLPVNKLARAIT